MLQHIAQAEFSDEFKRCWSVAGKHLHAQGDGRINWLKSDLTGPSPEHFSFRLGNQLFFVRLEDLDRKIGAARNDEGLLRIARSCNGIPCIMMMSRRSGSWAPCQPGWGLIDLRSGHDVDPVALISDERIEMTDWEVHDFAVQVVRRHLEREGRDIMSTLSDPATTPSLWFVGKNGPEWVIVRSARFPGGDLRPPDDWPDVAERCKALGTVGHFASVVVANADDSFDPTRPPLRLWRGHALNVRFSGLQQLGKKGWLAGVWPGRN